MHARPPRRRTKPNLCRDLTSSNKKHIFRGPGKRAESAEAGRPYFGCSALTGGCQFHFVATLLLDRTLLKSKLRVEAQGSV